MPLDRHAKRFLDMIAVGGMSEASELTPSKMRAEMVRLARTADVKNVPVGAVENRDLPGPGGPLPIRIYTPVEAAAVSPGIVFFHGGAGVFCSVETHDGFCRMLANASGCRVISVDYRLAPEHAFPAGLDDAYFATRWVSENAASLSVDPARLAVAGDSAGGTLGAAVCRLAKQRGGPDIALQAFFCPVTNLSAESQSRKTLSRGYFIDKTTLDWAKGLYCPPGVSLEDPRISPLCSADLSGLPPAHIHTAEFDPMHDEGKAYADALAAVGVPVRYVCHAGMIHHFYGLAGVIPQARVIIGEAGAAIRAAFAGAE